MKNTVKSLIAIAVAAIALTACTAEKQEPVSAPTTTTTTSAQAAPVQPVTETVHVTETQTKVVDPRPVLDDTGLGKLKLGMSYDEAMNTGLLGPNKSPDDKVCSLHDISGGQGAWVYISKRIGVSTITISAAMRTAKGISIGSTVDQLTAAYPDAEKVEAWNTWFVKVAQPKASYRFSAGDGKVNLAQINAAGQDCHS
ncbi:hypothetical protein [Lentzea sp. NBRC 105346]|uniref:hypothetical protein n=1 Tax=Lentzea sp. NBRC 105346 TaxID=3032205 RepID=UPI002556C7C3|nr:hypothetical protein [Lentzea sp. NBRC 105346]